MLATDGGVAAAAASSAAAASPAAVPAPAPAAPVPSARAVDVIEVSGRLDPIQDDFVKRSLASAERGDDEVLVIQLDSSGTLLDRSALDVLTFRLSHAKVPVAVWVGPSGSRAFGGATELVGAAGATGMAPGTHVGRDAGGPRTSPLSVGRSLGADEAKSRGAVSVVAPTLGEFVVGLDGQTVGGRVLSTARVVPSGQVLRREAAGDVRFAKLGLLERLLHAAAGPQVAYLLLVVGLLLVVFEFFTAGVGLAGVVGAGALVLSAYGLAVLPTSPLGLGLVGLGVAGLAVDVQSGAPRSWTVIGTLALLVGSWRLFPGGLALSWITIVVVVGGAVLLMVAGMASMLRARFSTPTIGREAMVGRMAEATTGIDPEGMVRLAGGLWRARTNRATPIASGDAVRVVAIDGLLLEVEPEVGGARDAGH
ncbi:MAG: NfeD family protein [Acidimicrobiales bacterium]